MLGQDGTCLRHPSGGLHFEIRSKYELPGLQEHSITADYQDLRMSIHARLISVGFLQGGENRRGVLRARERRGVQHYGTIQRPVSLAKVAKETRARSLGRVVHRYASHSGRKEELGQILGLRGCGLNLGKIYRRFDGVIPRSAGAGGLRAAQRQQCAGDALGIVTNHVGLDGKISGDAAHAHLLDARHVGLDG